MALAKRAAQKAVFAWFKALRGCSLSCECKRQIVLTFVLPAFSYGAEVWGGSKSERLSLDCVLRIALRAMLGFNSRVPTELLHWESGVPLASSRLDAAKLRWYERLKALPSTRLPAIMQGFSLGTAVRRGRPLAGTNWEKGVQVIKDQLTSVGIAHPFLSRSDSLASRSLAANIDEADGSNPSVPKLNNRALNHSLWSRDVQLSFTRRTCFRWKDSTRPLWFPVCMTASNPVLQDHLAHLSPSDARLVSLARVSIVGTRKYVYVLQRNGKPKQGKNC